MSQTEISIPVPPDERVLPRKKDHDKIWVVVQQGGSTAERYLHAYNTEKQAERGAELIEAGSYSVLLLTYILKEGPERVAYGLEAVVRELFEYLEAAPEHLALPVVRNRFRRRIRTLLSKAEANDE